MSLAKHTIDMLLQQKIIAPYLCLMDVLVLKQTNKHWYNSIESNDCYKLETWIKKVFDRKIIRDKNKGEEAADYWWNRVLKDNNFVISGSFLLHCLFTFHDGTVDKTRGFESDDIDFFMKKFNNNFLEDKELVFEFVPELKSNFEKSLYWFHDDPNKNDLMSFSIGCISDAYLFDQMSSINEDYLRKADEKRKQMSHDWIYFVFYGNIFYNADDEIGYYNWRKYLSKETIEILEKSEFFAEDRDFFKYAHQDISSIINYLETNINTESTREEINVIVMYLSEKYQKKDFPEHFGSIYRQRLNLFNFVAMKGNSLCKGIDQDFDLDFCKIIFDGKRLKIKNFNSVIKKQAEYNVRTFYRELIKCAESCTDFEKKFRSVMEKIDDRIRKYTLREFVVSKDELLQFVKTCNQKYQELYYQEIKQSIDSRKKMSMYHINKMRKLKHRDFEKEYQEKGCIRKNYDLIEEMVNNKLTDENEDSNEDELEQPRKKLKTDK